MSYGRDVFVDWYFCCALRANHTETAALLSVVDALLDSNSDDATLDAALGEVAASERWIQLFALGPMLRAAGRDTGGAVRTRVRDLVAQLAVPMDAAIGRLARLAIDDASADVLNESGRRAVAQLRPPRPAPAIAYLDIEDESAALLIAHALNHACRTEDVGESVGNDAALLAFIEEAQSGQRGRAVQLASVELGGALGVQAHRLIEVLWTGCGGGAWLQPDILAATARLRYPSDRPESFKALVREAATWSWLSAQIERVEQINDARRAQLSSLLDTPGSSALTAVLWQHALWAHAAQHWPEATINELAPGLWDAPPDNIDVRDKLFVRASPNRDRRDWGSAVHELLGYRGARCRIVVTEKANGAELTLPQPLRPPAFSPWVGRRSNEVRVGDNRESQHPPRQPVARLRLLGAGFTAVTLLRHGQWSPELGAFVLHVADYLDDAATTRLSKRVDPELTTGPMGGLVDRLKKSIAIVGWGFDARIPPQPFVELVRNPPSPRSTAHSVAIGRRGRQLVARWAAEALLSADAGAAHPWRAGHPELALDHLYRFVTDRTIHRDVRLEAASSLRTLYPGSTFDAGDWDWRTRGDEIAARPGSGFEPWQQNWRHFLLSPELSPEEWVRPLWPELGRDRLLPALLARAGARFVAALRGGLPASQAARATAWADEFELLLGAISAPIDFPRLLRRRWVHQLRTLQAVDPTPGITADQRDEVSGLVVMRVLQFGSASPADLNELFETATAALSAGIGRDTHLASALLQGWYTAPALGRVADDARLLAARAAIRSATVANLAQLAAASANRLDSTSQQPIGHLMLKWWHEASLAGRVRSNELVAIERLSESAADLADVGCIALTREGDIQAISTRSVGPRPGARRTAVVIERTSPVGRLLSVVVDGKSVTPAPDAWDPDLTRGFVRSDAALSDTWSVPAEWRDGWFPVPGSLLELLAALACQPSENVLTLTDFDDDLVWFVRRPGETYALSWTDVDLGEFAPLRRGDIGRRLVVRLGDGASPIVVTSVDDRNTTWKRKPDGPVEIRRGPDGGWWWDRLIEGFPPVAIELTEAEGGDRLEVDIGRWGPHEQRVASARAVPVAQYQVNVSDGDVDAFDRLLDVRIGDEFSVRVLHDPSRVESLAFTVAENLPVRVRTESVSMGVGQVDGRLTRNRMAIVDHVQTFPPELYSDDAASLQGFAGAHGLLASVPKSAGDLVTAIVASPRHPQQLTTVRFRATRPGTARAGDLLHVEADERTGDLRLFRRGRLIYVSATWTLEDETSDRVTGLYLGDFEFDGRMRSVWQRTDRPVLACLAPDRHAATWPTRGGPDRFDPVGATAEHVSGPRWRVDVGDGTALFGDGPRDGGSAVVNRADVHLVDLGDRRVRLQRRFTLARSRFVQPANASAKRWADYLASPRPLNAELRAASRSSAAEFTHAMLTEFAVPVRESWSKEVPLCAGQATPWAPDARYSATARVTLTSEPVTAIVRDVAPRSLSEFLLEEDGLVGRRPQRLQRPLHFISVENGDAVFERGHGDRLRVSLGQLSLDGKRVVDDHLPFFLGDVIRNASSRIEDNISILDLAMSSVRFSAARTLYEYAVRHRLVHTVHLVGREDGLAAVEHVEDLDLSRNATSGLVRDVFVSGAIAEGVSLRPGQRATAFGRLDTERFDRTRGREVVFRTVRSVIGDAADALHQNDLVFLRAGTIRTTTDGNDTMLTCEVPFDTPGRALEVTVQRRAFSTREHLLPFLAQLAPRGRYLAGRLLPVRILESHGRTSLGSLMDVPARPAAVLRALVHNHPDREVLATVVNRREDGVRLELDVGVFVFLRSDDDVPDFVGEVPPSKSVVRIVGDAPFALETVIRPDSDFLVPGRPVLTFAKNALLGRHAASQAWEKRNFTAGGLPNTSLAPARKSDFDVLVSTPHPRFARLDEHGRLDAATAVNTVRLDVDEHGAPWAIDSDGGRTRWNWAMMTHGDRSAADLTDWAARAEWRYHEHSSGHWSDGDPSQVRRVELGVRSIIGEPVPLVRKGSLRLRRADLARHALPSSELVDRLERDTTITAHVADAVRNARDGTPDGLYLELAPGRVVHLTMSLLFLGLDGVMRCMADFDPSAFAVGDVMSVAVRATSTHSPPFVELVSWRPSSRAAFGKSGAVLAIGRAEAPGGGSVLGAGRFTVIHPEPVGGALARVGRDNVVTSCTPADLRPGDTTLIECRDDGHLYVHGTAIRAVYETDGDRQRSLSEMVRQPESRRALFDVCGGTLPMTVETVRPEVVEVTFGEQPSDRLANGAHAIARVLGVVNQKAVLGVGGRIVTTPLATLLSDIPPEVRHDALATIAADDVIIRQDRSGCRSGFEMSGERSGAIDVKLAHFLDHDRRPGFICVEQWSRRLRWLDRDELGWARLSDEEAAQLVSGLAEEALPCVEDGPTLRLASAADHLLERLSTGAVARPTMLGAIPAAGPKAAWRGLALLPERLVARIEGQGDRPRPGTPLLAEVAYRRRGEDPLVVFTPYGQRPVVWDVPPVVLRWMRQPDPYDRWEGIIREQPVPDEPHARLLDAAARRPDDPAAVDALREGLRASGADLLELTEEPIALDGVPMLALARLTVGWSSREAGLADLVPFILRSVALRAARSVHLEVLARTWRPDINRADWYRLARAVANDPRVDDHGVLTSAKVDDVRQTVATLQLRASGRHPDALLDRALAALSTALGAIDDDVNLDDFLAQGVVSQIAKRLLADSSQQPGAVAAILDECLAMTRTLYGPWLLLPSGVELPREQRAVAAAALERFLGTSL